jgi:hypothetical protein
MCDGESPSRRPWVTLALAMLATLACGAKNPYRPGGGAPEVDAAEPGAEIDATPPSDTAAMDRSNPPGADARPAADAALDLPRDSAAPSPDVAPPAPDVAPPAPDLAPPRMDAAPGGPAVAASPAMVRPGATVTATWGGVLQPTNADWIGIYVPNAPSMPSITWLYTSSCTLIKNNMPRPAGSCGLDAPSTAGTYELRLFSTDGYILLARSAPFTVAP